MARTGAKKILGRVSWNIARLTANNLAAANADAQSPIRRSHAFDGSILLRRAVFLAETGHQPSRKLLAMKWSPELDANLAGCVGCTSEVS